MHFISLENITNLYEKHFSQLERRVKSSVENRAGLKDKPSYYILHYFRSTTTEKSNQLHLSHSIIFEPCIGHIKVASDHVNWNCNNVTTDKDHNEQRHHQKKYELLDSFTGKLMLVFKLHPRAAATVVITKVVM
jgi:hypothetical protein